MSLTGHLDVFPLEEVLRLLARSYKSGCLRVDSPDLHGRVYLNNGSLALATVGSDEDLRRQLIASKLVTEEALRSAEVGGKSLNDVAADIGSSQDLGDFFREEVVESLYRIRKPGRGQFVFNVDVAPRYRADTAFDVELCVGEADRRAAEWADIESVIPTIDLTLRISPEAPNGEPVTLAPNTWRLVAAFEGAGTIRSLADRLGMSRFRVAKDLTALVRSGLLEPVSSVPAEPPAVSPAYGDFAPTSPAPAWSEPVEDTPAPVLAEQEAAPPFQAEESEYATVRFGQPEAVEPMYNPFDAPEPAVEAAAEEPFVDPAEPRGPVPDSYNQGWWTEPVETEDAPEGQPSSSDDPKAPGDRGDSFLDRVFSQLEENPEGETPPQGTIHGFLKRRRMSSIGADEE
jgi:hypothetical protein